MTWCKDHNHDFLYWGERVACADCSIIIPRSALSFDKGRPIVKAFKYINETGYSEVVTWNGQAKVVQPGDTLTVNSETETIENKAAFVIPDQANVHHPPHYNDHPSGIECIQITEHMNFCKGNALKYLWRAGKKGGPEQEIEDLQKCIWYLEREIQRLQ